MTGCLNGCKHSTVHTLHVKAFNLVVFVVTLLHMPSAADEVKKHQEPGLATWPAKSVKKCLVI